VFTGRYPRGLFDFVFGVMRCGNRVTGYAVVLVTDEYPPFSLQVRKLREPVFRGLTACPERFPVDYLFGLLRFSVSQAA
jgi:hypothetical protein